MTVMSRSRKSLGRTVLFPGLVLLALIAAASTWVFTQPATVLVHGVLPVTLEAPVASCYSTGGPWSNWDGVQSADNADGEAVYTCLYYESGASQLGALTFADAGSSAVYHASNHFRLPADWTGTVDLRLIWFSGSTGSNVVWQVQTACLASGGDYTTTTWNTAQKITAAAAGTSARLVFTTKTGITTTGCSAGNLFKYRLFRDPSDAGDTLGNDAWIVGVEWTYRRTL